MEIISNLEIIEQKAKEKENENWEFLSFLKNIDNKNKLVILAQNIYKDIEKQIDCTSCGNCCKNNILVMDENDINRFLLIIDKNKEEYKKEYLHYYKSQNIYIMNRVPCPYLKDNKCSIYEYRANSCRVYPELKTFEHIISIGNIIKNTSICPIIYNFYEFLKIETGFRN